MLGVQIPASPFNLNRKLLKMIKFTKWINLSILAIVFEIAMYFVSYIPNYEFFRIWAYVTFPLTLVALVWIIVKDIKKSR